MFLFLSRTLLFLVGVLLAIIPCTESYCALDNFPQGQDFETNLLAFLALVGLMLLVAHLCRQGIAALFSIRCWISRLIPTARPTCTNPMAGFAASCSHRARLPTRLSAACNLPLQI